MARAHLIDRDAGGRPLVSGAAWFTLAVVSLTIAVLATERVSAPITLVGAVTVLLLGRVIDASQALAGFSNEAPVTIAALYVIARAAEATGALDAVTALVTTRRPHDTRRTRAPRGELGQMLGSAAGVSSVLYNTPTVGMLGPAVERWARNTGRPASWYLLPLNYAIVLGGLVTTIGTTTNVVVSGLLENSGHKALQLFEVTPIGLPIAVVGIGVLLLAAPRLVPTLRDPNADVVEGGRSYTVDMVVPSGSPLVGRTVADAQLRNLQGVYLVEMAHGERVIAPVGPDQVLLDGSRLTFAGDVEHVVDLHRIPGLESAQRALLPTDTRVQRRYFEAVISPGSSLVGTTLKDADFRRRFNAAVVAIHRAGEPVAGKLGSVRLHAGDVLLLLAGPDFAGRARGGDFLLSTTLQGAPPPRRERAWIVGSVMAAFVVLTATGVLSVLEASLTAAIVVVASGVLTPREARDAVDLNVIVVLATSFGLGNAIASSGLAGHLAHMLTSRASSLGDTGLLAAILIATVVITQLVTNNAAAIVMFPIAMATATGAGLHARPFALAVAIGASCGFLTPIAYQTNLMVQGLAGYRFKDFSRLGWVLLPTTISLSILLIPAVSPLR